MVVALVPLDAVVVLVVIEIAVGRSSTVVISRRDSSRLRLTEVEVVSVVIPLLK